MLEPHVSPLTRAWLERIQAMPINASDQEHARAEFERAEAWAERVLRIAERWRRAVWGLRRSFLLRHQRHG
jgi:hypothetical protein